MQVFGNIASEPVRKILKSAQNNEAGNASTKGYYEFRLCENHRGDEKSSQWYTVRLSKSADPGLAKGSFVRISGKLKVDSFLSKEGKPTSSLLIIAFEAVQLKSAAELLAAAQAKKQEAVPA